MKANELMIGDWVTVTKESGDSCYVRIIAPAPGGSNTCEEQAEKRIFTYRIYNNERLSPIPLTPAILKRIGFKKDKGGEESWYSKAGWMVPSKYNRKAEPISWEVEIIGKYNFDGVIKYVHQLQHALQLCGIRKQINL